jgi:hypothetical protein
MWEKDDINYMQNMVKYAMSVDISNNSYSNYTFDDNFLKTIEDYSKQYNTIPLVENRKNKLGRLNIQNLERITEIDPNLMMCEEYGYPHEYHIRYNTENGTVADIDNNYVYTPPVLTRIRPTDGMLILSRIPKHGRYLLMSDSNDSTIDRIPFETIIDIDKFISRIWKFINIIERIT